MAVLAPMPSASERMATVVNAGRLARDRTPSRTSRATPSWSPDSQAQPPRPSRSASLCASTPPNAARARRRASRGSTPASRTNRSVSMSRWKRNSSSIRCSTSSSPNSRTRRRARAASTHRIRCSATPRRDPRRSAANCRSPRRVLADPRASAGSSAPAGCCRSFPSRCGSAPASRGAGGPDTASPGVSRLLNALAIARADGRYPKLSESLSKTKVLVMDDWGWAPGLAPLLPRTDTACARSAAATMSARRW